MKNNKILVAVSGGVDSIFLLNFLEQQFPKDNLIIGHFNHNLRGEESDGDEDFVRRISEEKGIKFFSEKAEKNLIKSEDDARKFRYEFLGKVAEKEGCNFIATAHHKNDQIETLFLQLIRGTANFSPMLEKLPVPNLGTGTQINIWRPLLNFSKKEILNFAEMNDLKWREDSTNKENIFTRNKIRNEIFPELEKLNKNFGENLLNLAKISGENFSCLEKILEEKMKNSSDKNHFGNIVGNGLKPFPTGEKTKNFFTKKFFDELDISLKKILIKKIFEKNNLNGNKRFSKNFTSENISEVNQMIEKGKGKKEKHGFFLEKGVVYFGNK